MDKIIHGTFASIYNDTIFLMKEHNVSLSCRNQQICYEIINYQCVMDMSFGISIYSHEDSRAIPITFVLGEFLWIIGAYNEVKLLEKFNKSISQYSDDGEILNGAYGPRIMPLLPKCIQKLVNDQHSRQAYIPIFRADDLFVDTRDVPCNTSLQFLIRDNRLILIVTSRSSDFITGFSIDGIHWQLLFMFVWKTLQKHYPQLQPEKIFYNIGSLHVYALDKPIFLKWNASDYFSHTIPYGKTKLDEIAKTSIALFSNVTTLNELMEIFRFTNPQKDIVYKLHNIFINRKHKIKR